MQKYEADIRAHVKMQKEMQKQAEALQIKCEDSEQVQQTTEQKFIDLERRHYTQLTDFNTVKEENRKQKILQEEIDKYNSNIGQVNSSVNQYNKREISGLIHNNSSSNINNIKNNKKKVHLRTTSCQKLNLNSTSKVDSRNTSLMGHSEFRNNSKDRKGSFVSPKNCKENRETSKIGSNSKGPKNKDSVQTQSKKDLKKCLENYFNANTMTSTSKNTSKILGHESKLSRSKQTFDNATKIDISRKYL